MGKRRDESNTVSGQQECPRCGARHRTITPGQCADRAMSEKQLQARVVGHAKRRGWRVAHAGKGFVGSNAEGTGRWVTQMSAGWPDLFLLNPNLPPYRLAIELKRELADPDPEQVEWLRLMNDCGIPAFVIRPSDVRLARLQTILEGRG